MDKQERKRLRQRRRKRRQLFSLWEAAKGICAYCKGHTVLIFRSEHTQDIPFLPNEATIEHIRSRYDETRQIPPEEDGVYVRHLMVCRECNSKKDKEDTAEQPIQELRRRSKQHGLKKSPPQ